MSPDVETLVPIGDRLASLAETAPGALGPGEETDALPAPMEGVQA
jgi:hypothetical protein